MTPLPLIALKEYQRQGSTNTEGGTNSGLKKDENLNKHHYINHQEYENTVLQTNKTESETQETVAKKTNRKMSKRKLDVTDQNK